VRHLSLETRARLVLAYDAYQGPEQLHTALLGLHELRIAVPSSALILAEQHAPTYQAPVGVPAPPFPQPAVQPPPFPQPAVQSPVPESAFQSPPFPQPAAQPPTLAAPTVQQLPAPAPAARPPAIPQASPEPTDPVG
jgi:hypothetical protein